jgi:hypothetical protein
MTKSPILKDSRRLMLVTKLITTPSSPKLATPSKLAARMLNTALMAWLENK